MREIKFRKWHKELQDMTFWDGSKGSNNLFWHTLTEYPEMYSLMQFTGSVDRNGNEIYEGDIVLLDEGFYPRNRPIVFSEYGAWNIGELGISFGQMKADGFVHCEVIGNIYQNPKLLERSAKADA